MDKNEFIVEDYKMKVEFFTKHFSRVWMRFNFFLALQGAFIGIGLKTLIENHDKDIYSETSWFLILNIFICIIWYIFGAQDRFLTILYRNQGHLSGQLCAEEFEIGSYEPVGVTKNTAKSITPSFSAIQWRANKFSMTKLPVVVPIIFFIIWTGISLRHFFSL